MFGSPTGVETIQISSFNDSICDQSRNIMLSGQYTDQYTLFPAPTVISNELNIENSYIQLNFSENVYSSYDNEPISLLDFELMRNSF